MLRDQTFLSSFFFYIKNVGMLSVFKTVTDTLKLQQQSFSEEISMGKIK